MLTASIPRNRSKRSSGSSHFVIEPLQVLRHVRRSCAQHRRLLLCSPALYAEADSRPVERRGHVDSTAQDFQVPFENHTSHSSAGKLLLYPGGFSETDFLFCYGGVHFASKMGTLAANHFLTVTEGMEDLRALGEMVLWKGTQDVRFKIGDQGMIREFRASRRSKL
ncbi:hypothetical protein VTL71DRAFT_9530 [Oculimacula yallundae]|uniref:Uncharacterized protein n=1 Tax=Oculimacula yallundae TaxID=86028 RepID=A0ABR4BTX2_9HELO